MKDVLYTTAKPGLVPFVIQGKTTQDNTILYQRIICILCSNSQQPYRQEQGTTLTDLLIGGNIPDAAVLTSMAKMAQIQVYRTLDQQDKDRIQSLTLTGVPTSQGAKMQVYLVFTDGTTLQGIV